MLRSRTPDLAEEPRARWPWVYGRAIGDALVASAFFLFLAALIDLTDEHEDALVLGVAAVLALSGGLFSFFRYRGHRALRLRDGFTVIPVTWTTLIVASSLVYLTTGTVDGLVPALWESVAGFTTTNASILENIEETGRGMLFWRSATQWMGGFGALVVMVAVLPRVTGTRDFVERTGLRQAMVPSAGAGLRNLAMAYVGLSGVTYLLYELAGMATFDAIAHSMTTVSTGGFSTRAGSFGAYDSAALEWAGVAAMTLAGVSCALVWWLARGALEPVLRSIELRVYLLVLLGSAALVTLTGDAVSIRESAFLVSSVSTTTGFGSTAVDAASSGAIVLLMLLAVCGAMGGSASGGLGMNRAIALVQIARRELKLELYPRAVVALKGDGRAYGRRSVEFVVGLEILTAIFVMSGAFGLAMFDVDLLGAVSSSIGYLSTTGGPLVPHETTSLSGLGKITAMLLMFFGRLAILPVVVSLFDARLRLFRRHKR